MSALLLYYNQKEGRHNRKEFVMVKVIITDYNHTFEETIKVVKSFWEAIVEENKYIDEVIGHDNYVKGNLIVTSKEL